MVSKFEVVFALLCIFFFALFTWKRLSGHSVDDVPSQEQLNW